MDITDDLPCPGCGSTKTLGKLHRKLRRTERRVEEERKKRYPEPPPPPINVGSGGPVTFNATGRTSIAPQQIYGFTASSMSLAPAEPSWGPNLEIRTVDGGPDDPGSVVINDAILDVCCDCGTFYSPNAKRLGDSIEKQTIMLDPLFALAEAGKSDHGTEVSSGQQGSPQEAQDTDALGHDQPQEQMLPQGY